MLYGKFKTPEIREQVDKVLEVPFILVSKTYFLVNQAKKSFAILQSADIPTIQLISFG